MDYDDHKLGVITTGEGCCMVMAIRRCPKGDDCMICNDRWVRGLYGRFADRLERSGALIAETVLWTLGTSMDDSLANRAILRKHWNRFRVWMDKHTDWSPIFRVVETGSKAGKLHIHFISTNFIDHEVVLGIWRGFSGENSNVNFSFNPGGDVHDILRYMIKYLVKDKSRYSWMGFLYEVGKKEVVKKSCEHGLQWEYMAWYEVGPGDPSSYKR